MPESQYEAQSSLRNLVTEGTTSRETSGSKQVQIGVDPLTRGPLRPQQNCLGQTILLTVNMDLHPRRGIHGKTGSFGQAGTANRWESPHQRQVRQLQRHTISHGGLEMMPGEIIQTQQVTLPKGVPQAHIWCRLMRRQVWTKSCWGRSLTEWTKPAAKGSGQ